ncbi:MAG: hypothetical protein AAGF92_02235 [Myxococcota bacterium]
MGVGRVLALMLLVAAAGCDDECVPRINSCECGLCVDDFGCNSPDADPCRCFGECGGSGGEGAHGGEGGSGGRGGVGGQGMPADPETTNGVIQLREEQKRALATVYCSCRAFLDDLEAAFQAAVDEETCVAGLTTPDADFECLSRNFGSEPRDAVPGLACDLDANVEATACIEALECGADDAPQATECFFDLDDRIDGCDFGSISSEDPPELLECF